MAIPDSTINDHYFYISGYSGHDSLDTSRFPPLDIGEWRNKGFKGAVLPASGSTVAKGVAFFQKAYQIYVL